MSILKKTPRDYQLEAAYSIWNYLCTKSGNPIVAMPTATGKSLVIALILQMIYHYYPNQRVLMLTHVKELIRQNYDELIDLWPTAPVGIYSAGLKKRELYNPITFAGIASIAKIYNQFGRVDLVFIDEAHLVNPTYFGMYNKVLAGLAKINPALKVIGLTATPWRLGHGRITDDGLFTEVCFDLTGQHAFNRLIAEGYLCPLIPKNPETILDISGVHIRGGEFIQSELQRVAGEEYVTRAIVEECIHIASDRNRWLMFCTGIDHAELTAKLLNEKGISAAAVHSKLHDKERDYLLKQHQTGQIQVLTNNNVLTTGYNDPQIDYIGAVCPTQSAAKWVQMLGRGTRIYPGKLNCLVGDFAGNTKRLGPINDPVMPRRKGEGGGEAPVKLCDQCGTWNHASVRTCICCGHEFIFETKISQNASNDELIKGELPVVEVFPVGHITISKHCKKDRNGIEIGTPSLRVSYFTGVHRFNDFVCLQHHPSNYTTTRARSWWRARISTEPPTTIDAALEQADSLAVPTHIRVWVNKQGGPEVMSHCFDGTAFGTQEGILDLPTVDVKHDGILKKLRIHDEDDIPF